MKTYTKYSKLTNMAFLLPSYPFQSMPIDVVGRKELLCNHANYFCLSYYLSSTISPPAGKIWTLNDDMGDEHPT